MDIHAERKLEAEQAHDAVRRYGLMSRVHARVATAPRPLSRFASTVRLAATRAAAAPRVVPRSLDVRRFGRAARTGRLLHQAAPLIDLDCPVYDVIHAHFAPNGVKALQLREAGALQGPVLTHFYGRDLNVGHQADLRRRYRDLFGKGEAFVAITRFMASRAIELGCPPQRISILPLCIELRDSEFRIRRESPHEAVQILTVARLVEKKGVEYMIRAVAMLRDRGVAVRYVVAGEGPLRAALAQLAHELGVEDRVVFAGPQTQQGTRSLYDQAQLFVLPSVTAADGDKEGQGLVLQEAQACGLPVVTTRHNGIPEGVAEGDSALLVPERDANALANALERLIQEPQCWPKMGRAGRTLIERKFDAAKADAKMLEMYKRLALVSVE